MDAKEAVELIRQLEEEGHLTRLHNAEVGNLWTTSISVLQEFERQIEIGEG